MGVECLWKGAMNHEKLTNTGLVEVVNTQRDDAVENLKWRIG